MTRDLIDFSPGEKVNRWRVLGRADAAGNWNCECECGTNKTVDGHSIRSGKSKSCGCHKREKLAKEWSERYTIHGMTNSAEYRAWSGMIDRCESPNRKDWDNYGGRGIKVCDRWRRGENGKTGFELFFADMGPRLSQQHSLDRYPNNDGNYEPGNCRWATREEQNNNQRPRRKRNMLKRKSIPLSVKIWTILHQNGKCTECGEPLTDVKNLNFDHRPPLMFRPLNTDGTDYDPPQLDPKHIEAIHRTPCHHKRTYGPGGDRRATTRGGDLHEAARMRGIKDSEAIHQAKLASKRGDYSAAATILATARKSATKPKRKWPSRPFPKRRKVA